MKDFGLRDRFIYDGDLCYEAYLNFKKGIVPEESLLTYMKRYVIMHVKSRYKRLGYDICNDLIQAAVLELWILIRKQKIPDPDVFVFHSFLNTVISRSTAKEFRVTYGRSLEEIPYDCYESRHYCRDATPQDVEDQMYLEELPKILIGNILKKIRFEDPKIRSTLKYVLERILARRRIVPDWIRRKWGFGGKTVKFLTEHAYIILRAELYELRKDINMYPKNSKKDIMSDIFEQSVWSREE
jgi:hypothetical protein